MTEDPNRGTEYPVPPQPGYAGLLDSDYAVQGVDLSACEAAGVDPDHVMALKIALKVNTREALDRVVDDMLSDGIPREAIADFYVPYLSRVLGDAWVEDELSFAEVTIGVSRLQGMLRRLGPEWRADFWGKANAPSVLILTCADEYHTLGAMVLSGQLRRMGISTQLNVGMRPERVGACIRSVGFDLILISAAAGEGLDPIRRLVDACKKSVSPCPFVVLGGSILDSTRDVIRLTGADAATCDPSEALELCGLSISPAPAPLSAIKV